MAEKAEANPSAPLETAGGDHGGLWGRVREHKIIQWGVGYLGAALALAHGQELLGHAFHWPELVGRLFMVLLIAGLPIALTFAWYHGHRGLKQVGAGELTIISVLVLIAALFFTVSLRPEHGAEGSAPPSTRSADGATLPPSSANPPSETRRALLGDSIAVLPFDNHSQNANEAMFASGIHEQVINRLARIKNLTVIARTAVLRYTPGSVSIRDVGRELEVRWVIESTIRFVDGSVRISPSLVDADTERVLWTGDYKRPFESVFELETDIATQIVTELETELAPGERRGLARQSTTSAEAYAQFLRAGAALSSSAGGVGVSPEESAEFHRHLGRALEIDPGFALGYAAKARDYAYSMARLVPRASGLSFEDREVLATTNAQQALSLDPDNGLAHAALATMHRVSGRAAEAQVELDKALALSPNDYQVLFDAVLLSYAIRNGPAALEYARRAARVNPLEGFLPLGLAFVAAGDYDAAAEQFASHPEYPTMPLEYARVELLRGNKASALRSLREQEKRPLRPPATIPLMAYLYHIAGADDDARRVAAALQPFAEDYAVRPSDRVLVALASGNDDEALSWLQRSLERALPGTDAGTLGLIARNALSDPVLERPEFVEIRKQLLPGGL